MMLNNLILADGHRPITIEISNGIITDVRNTCIGSQANTLQISFDRAVAFPGLINSHDHLDFNLFPQLGNKIYSNYTEWGKYLHQNHKHEISRVLKVPVPLREHWGILKNMLCGVTTVVNHGKRIKIRDTLINVHERYHCIHSVRFEKRWKISLNNPLKATFPVVIHVGEGSDLESHHEIDRLTRWNLLNKTLIGVHGVAMSERQAKKFKALVWCPQSNYFLLNKTACIDSLKEQTNILFGTDSTLTGHWNIWDHIRTARGTKMFTDTELYHTLNVNAANTWQLKTGNILPGNEADIVVAGIKERHSPMETFFSTGPKDILLVLHRGNVRVFDETLYSQLAHMDLSGFSKIYVNGACKYVQGNVPELIKNIRAYYPEANIPVSTGQIQSLQ